MCVIKYLKIYQSKEKSLTESLKIYITVHGNDENIDNAKAMNNIGLVYMNEKKYEKALFYLEQSLVVKKKIFENNNINEIGKVEFNIGVAYHLLDDFEKALEHLDKSLVLYREFYGNDHHIEIDDILKYINFCNENFNNHKKELKADVA